VSIGSGVYESRKAVEAAAVLARQSPGNRINHKRLLVLLYIANRECIRQSARPLVGGRLAALKYGPIHSDVDDLIKQRQGRQGKEQLADWSRHFHTEHYDVVLDEDPGVNALSRFEERLLVETSKKHEDEDTWDLAHKIHRLREYALNFREGRGRTITLEELLRAVNLGAMANSIVRDLKEKQEMNELFESAEKAIREQ
jgi:uncharacterized phage-associated protein